MSSDESKPDKSAARAWLQAGDRARALPAYEALRAETPDDVAVLDALGFLYFMSGRTEEARDACLRSIELRPGNFYAHKGLGLCLARLGQVEDGIASLRRSIELNPSYFDSQHDLGIVLAEFGRWDEATECFARAIELDPSREAEVRRLLARRGQR